jgi:hypothetical protein
MTGATKPTGAPITIHNSSIHPPGSETVGADSYGRKQGAEARRHPHRSLAGGEDGIFTRSNEWLADLSVGGAFMQGTGTTRGSILNLRFKLPGSDDFITATAITRHTRNSGFGVEFLDRSSDNVKRLATFIDENS